jgi:hypothetical protein
VLDLGGLGLLRALTDSPVDRVRLQAQRALANIEQTETPAAAATGPAPSAPPAVDAPPMDGAGDVPPK